MSAEDNQEIVVVLNPAKPDKLKKLQGTFRPHRAVKKQPGRTVTQNYYAEHPDP